MENMESGKTKPTFLISILKYCFFDFIDSSSVETMSEKLEGNKQATPNGIASRERKHQQKPKSTFVCWY